MNQMNDTPQSKREIKLIKEALRFVGINIDIVKVILLLEEKKEPKCFWTISVHNARDITGSYMVRSTEHTRMSVIMAIGLGLYLETKQGQNENG